jgi:hypothetical protein
MDWRSTWPGCRLPGRRIPGISRVTGAYGMPGGGWEMQFPYGIGPEFLTPTRRAALG